VVDQAALGSVRIALGRLLDGVSCGDQPGQIDHFSVTLSGGTDTPLVQSVACDASAEALFAKLSPRQRVSAYVTALSADGGEAFAGATCDAFTRPDASVDAECTSLSRVGTLRVDLAGALALFGLQCDDASIDRVLVNVPGEEEERSFPPPDCRQPFTHGFAPGAAAVTLTVIDGAGNEKSATCGAAVTPGQLAIAECTMNPP
jgi:hypothetical protein